MQSRAADLHLLVYDFFGVTSVFGALAVLVYFFSWAWSRVNVVRMASRLEKRNKLNHPTWRQSLRVVSILVSMLTVCYFLVGMLHNLRLGLIMLAAPVSVLVLSIPCIFLIRTIVFTFKCYHAQRDAKDDIEARRE
jgi:choline-glycine betaine transporter